ncbi:MAG: hypothetical protein K2G29_01615, partial [Muribaculaceae bacterium]|nr:hypothetical protein [Muribaculaceae bacterium]
MASIVSLWKGDIISICIKSEGHMLLMSIRSFQEPIASRQLIVARALFLYASTTNLTSIPPQEPVANKQFH